MIAVVLCVLPTPGRALTAQSTRERVTRDIRALARQDADRGQPRTALVVSIERDNRAGLRPGDVAHIYTQAYDQARRSIDDSGTWPGIRSKLPWVAAVLALLIAIFRDTVARWLNDLVARGERALIRRLASSRLLRRRVLARYGTWLLNGTRRVALPFREDQHLDIDDVIVPLRVIGTDGEHPANAEQALLEDRRVVLTGEPGAGKSMTIRHLARMQARRLVAHDTFSVPVLLELRELGAVSVRERIVQTLSGGGFPNADAFVERALHDGGMTVLLDGLDEVASSEREGTIKLIRHFLTSYEHCRVVITCRRAVYRGELDDLIDRRYALDALDDQQVQVFLGRWERFMPAGKSSQQLLQSLRDHPRLMGSARNPLLLTMIAHLYTHVQDYVLPHSRADFYEGATRLLLSEWRAQPNHFQQPEKRKALRELALRSQAVPAADGDLATFPLEDALDELRKVLPTVGRDPAEARDMLDEIVERSGLLVAIDGGERYRFTHQTFQEFLAADKLREHADDLLARFEQDRDGWREVLKLWCGLADDATAVVQRVEVLEPVSALECLADAANIDPDVATAVMAPLRETLRDGTATPAVERAFGAVASDPRPRGRAVFNDLVVLFTSAEGSDVLGPIARALSYTNLPAAARLLADRSERSTAVRKPLERMGDLAVPVLGELALNERDSWSISALLQIATPDAAAALVPVIAFQGPLAGAAAWSLASLLSRDVIRRRLCEDELRRRIDQFGLTFPPSWVWDPFVASAPHEAPLGPIVGRIVTLMQSHSRPVLVTQIEPRVAVACLALPGGIDDDFDRGAMASERLLLRVSRAHLMRDHRLLSGRRPTTPTRLATAAGTHEALLRTSNVPIAEVMGEFSEMPSERISVYLSEEDLPRMIDQLIHEATIHPDRWQCCLQSLSPTAAWMLLMGLWRTGAVTRTQWSATAQRPKRFEFSITLVWLRMGLLLVSLVATVVVGVQLGMRGVELGPILALAGLNGGWAYLMLGDTRLDDDEVLVALLSPFGPLLAAVFAVRERRSDHLRALLALGFAPAIIGTLTAALHPLLPLAAIVIGWCVVIACFVAVWVREKRRDAVDQSFIAGLFADAPVAARA